MQVAVIDGQGGGIGRAIIERIKSQKIPCEILAVGTNSIASQNMKKAGADLVATGENPVIVAAAHANVIMGAIGIVLANSLLGEITPKMADAIAGSTAQKILIPQNKCKVTIAGVNTTRSLTELIDEAIELLRIINIV